MNAIEAMQIEIGYQVQDLEKLDLQSPVEDCLFVGSGDSYVAALAAKYFSGTHSHCYHPVDIIKNPLLVKGHNVFIVSVSGNTKANVLAAKIVRRFRVNTSSTALTARPSSRLAKACDNIIHLKYKSSGIFTAGTISFTVSMIECISLMKKLSLPTDIAKIYDQSEKQAEQVVSKMNRRRESYIILGNGLFYPIAMYAALKFNEVFGARAVAYPSEEFCHAPIFSIKDNDQIIVMEDTSNKLSKRLNQEGFSSVDINFKGTGIELLIRSTFFIQLLVLKLAQKNGLSSCYFLKSKKLLKLSSDFIYG
jgi:fructoselysine-6-P-deglycase FrlB-like protein